MGLTFYFLYFHILSGDTMMHGYGMYGWYHPGWIFQILIFLAFLLIVWWMLKTQATKEEPIDILKRRLAQGEITKQEFERLKKEIE